MQQRYDISAPVRYLGHRYVGCDRVHLLRSESMGMATTPRFGSQ